MRNIMLDLIEVFERADKGPLISDTDYYMKRFVPTLKTVIARYKITWNKTTIVNTDDDLADRIFQAAVDLLAEAGAYCPDTNRVMEFTPRRDPESDRAGAKSGAFWRGT